MSKTHNAALLVPVAILFSVVLTPEPAAAQSCEALTSLKLQNATITMAQPVAAGAFTPPPGGRGAGRGGGNPFADLPAFCRVAATLTPSAHAR